MDHRSKIVGTFLYAHFIVGIFIEEKIMEHFDEFRENRLKNILTLSVLTRTADEDEDSV